MCTLNNSWDGGYGVKVLWPSWPLGRWSMWAWPTRISAVKSSFVLMIEESIDGFLAPLLAWDLSPITTRKWIVMLKISLEVGPSHPRLPFEPPDENLVQPVPRFQPHDVLDFWSEELIWCVPVETTKHVVVCSTGIRNWYTLCTGV